MSRQFSTLSLFLPLFCQQQLGKHVVLLKITQGRLQNRYINIVRFSQAADESTNDSILVHRVPHSKQVISDLASAVEDGGTESPHKFSKSSSGLRPGVTLHDLI
jgi:hypothetical protein